MQQEDSLIHVGDLYTSAHKLDHDDKHAVISLIIIEYKKLKIPIDNNILESLEKLWVSVDNDIICNLMSDFFMIQEYLTDGEYKFFVETLASLQNIKTKGLITVTLPTEFDLAGVELDVRLIMQHTGASEDASRASLLRNNGDIVSAIMDFE